MNLEDFNKSLTGLVEQRENELKTNFPSVSQKPGLMKMKMRIREHGNPMKNKQFYTLMAVDEHGKPFNNIFNGDSDDETNNIPCTFMAVEEHGRPFDTNNTPKFITRMAIGEHGKPFIIGTNNDNLYAILKGMDGLEFSK